MSSLPVYLIVSMQHTRVQDGYVSFLRPDLEGVTQNVSEAGEYSEDVVNNNLSFFDDGEKHLAILKEAVDQHSNPVVMLTELTCGALEQTHNQIRSE